MAVNEKRQRAMRELLDLKFAVASMAQLVNEPGSFKQQNARNISLGIDARIDALAAEFDAVLDELTGAAVANKLGSGAVAGSGGAGSDLTLPLFA